MNWVAFYIKDASFRIKYKKNPLIIIQFSQTIQEEETNKFETVSGKKKPPIFITKTSKNINRRINIIKEHSTKEKSILLTLPLIIILFTLGNIPSAIFAIITSVELRSKNWFEVEKNYLPKLSIKVKSFFMICFLIMYI